MLLINCASWVRHEFTFVYFGISPTAVGKRLVLSEDSEAAETKPFRRRNNLRKMCGFLSEASPAKTLVTPGRKSVWSELPHHFHLRC